MIFKKITNPFFVSVLQGLWKNSGNLIHFYFIWWQASTALELNYSLNDFLYWTVWNYSWFAPSMVIFFIFRFWADNYGYKLFQSK